jgi:hypothetical protein
VRGHIPRRGPVVGVAFRRASAFALVPLFVGMAGIVEIPVFACVDPGEWGSCYLVNPFALLVLALAVGGGGAAAGGCLGEFARAKILHDPQRACWRVAVQAGAGMAFANLLAFALRGFLVQYGEEGVSYDPMPVILGTPLVVAAALSIGPWTRSVFSARLRAWKFVLRFAGYLLGLVSCLYGVLACWGRVYGLAALCIVPLLAAGWLTSIGVVRRTARGAAAGE